ncbi:MAG: hypothetical protein RMX96_18335 [Nostoc sp. ChiSLP02]|nr:hypothetical protein [Nostoc sp. DedSLP05]MDZ8099876.1 hypothetical protein [Nostoc sp. DedSLP01]MDZ8186795.1 hypothetical protein [Nostoc sp. ChiSLP02]
MTPEELTTTLTELFGTNVSAIAPDTWQVNTSTFRLLVLLSKNNTWLRVLLPIAPLQEAQSFLAEFLSANFDETQEVRYALHDGQIWAVFHHHVTSLVKADFERAIARLVSLHETGLDNVFNRLVETRIRQVIKAAKLQGQSLESTIQNLERFYAEGVMGEIDQGAQAQEQSLAAWRRQLERLWNEE